jgi:hypothetical protein
MYLDRSNIASKNDCENANTLTHDKDHLVVLACLRRRWSLSGREGFRCFRGVETTIFHYVESPEKKRMRTEVTEVTGRWTKCGLCMTGRIRSAFSICVCFSLMIGRAARPVTVDRARPVVQGAYWILTERWHYRVRSVLQRVRSLFSCALLRHDQRVRSFSGPAHPVSASSASGQCFTT